MTSKYWTVIFMFLASASAYGQGFVWATQIGASGPAAGDKVAVDPSGNVLVAGGYQGTARFGITNLPSAGDVDVFLAKYNSAGTLQWARRSGGTAQDVASQLAVDPFGNIYVVGWFQGTANFSGTNLQTAGSMGIGTVANLFLAKYDPDGGLIWIKQAGGGGGGVGIGIALDSNQNVYTTGYSREYSGWYSITVDKWDVSGSHLWHKEYPGTPNYNGILQGNSVAVDTNGNAFVVGQFTTSVTIGTNTLSTPGNAGVAIFVAKFAPDGNVLWAEQPDTPTPVISDTALSVGLDVAGNPVITGSYRGDISFGTNQLPSVSQQTSQAFLAKCTTDGLFIWARQIGGTGSSGNSLAVDSSNNIYVAGSSSPSEIFLHKFDSNGIFRWGLSPAHNLYSGGFGTAVGDSNRTYLVTWNSGNVSFDSLAFTNIGGGDIFVSQIAEEVPPVFTVQPRSSGFGFLAGSSITFSSATRSLFPVSYQWWHNAAPLLGATNSALTITNAQVNDQGGYWVVATNIFGSSTSSIANLTIYYTLTLHNAGSGSVTVSPVNTNIFPASQTLTLTAIPYQGYSFVSWSGDLSSTNNPLLFAIQSNMTVLANFSDALTNIIVDNLDTNATFTGSWSTGAFLPGHYASDYRLANCSVTPTTGVVYRPTIAVSGFYNVSIWYPQNSINSTKAPWSVSSLSGTTNVFVDQRIHGGGWFRIASAQYFPAGNSGFVALSNSTGESSSRTVVADAVQFLGCRPPAPSFSTPTGSTGPFSLTLNVVTGLTYTIESSSNLLDWFPLVNVDATNTTIYFQDPQAVGDLRFYRAFVR